MEPNSFKTSGSTAEEMRMEHEAAMEESRIELEAVKRQMEEQEQEYEREYQKALEQAAQTALDRKQGIDNEGDYPGDFETGEEKLPYPSEEAYLNGVMDEEVEKFTAKLEELNMQKLAWEEKIAEENMAKEVIHKQTSHLKEIEPNAEENGEDKGKVHSTRTTLDEMEARLDGKIYEFELGLQKTMEEIEWVQNHLGDLLVLQQQTHIEALKSVHNQWKYDNWLAGNTMHWA